MNLKKEKKRTEEEMKERDCKACGERGERERERERERELVILP
jgi:hypothetical protein